MEEVAAFGKFLVAMDSTMKLEVLEHGELGEVSRSKTLAKSFFFGTVPSVVIRKKLKQNYFQNALYLLFSAV